MDSIFMRQKMMAALLLLPVFIILGLLLPKPATPPQITVTTIADDLRNPRGVAVFPDGRLLVVEAGDGAGSSRTGGHIRVFSDGNGDGDYDDADERQIVTCCVGGYNTLTHFGTGQDEIGGLGDVVLLEDGRIFYTQDDPLGGYIPDGSTGGIAVMGLTTEPEWRRYVVAVRSVTTNALVYDPHADVLYMAESGFNRISRVTLDGEVTPLVDFPELAHGQQAVPSGLTRDPRTGDLLVALFSGQIRTYYGTVIAYMPEDARIVRLNPATGEWHDEIIGLTTAVDVAIDERGNLYVVELATGWASAVMPREFPLFDPDAPPDAGGYPRFSGRVTMYPADGRAPILLAQGLDEPTNITYYDGALYVSAGQGTPGRPIMSPDGRTRITGILYRITGFR
jgi:hypothetical protein